MAAIVDGRLRELTYALAGDATLAPLDATTTDGVRIYRRSLSFLMLVAFDEVFPDSEIFIEHSATTAAGYYCEVRGRGHFTAGRIAGRRAPHARDRRRRCAHHPRARLPRGGDCRLRVARRGRQGAPAGASGSRLADAVPPSRPARLPAGIHGAVNRLPHAFRAARAADRLHAAVSAPAPARKAGAPDALPEAVRGVRAGERLARPARHPKRGRAERRDRRRPDPRRVAGRRGAARSRHRPDREPHRRDAWKDPRRVHRRAEFFRQDHLLEAAGGPVAGQRHPADAARPRRLLRGPRRDASRREGRVRLRDHPRPRSGPVRRSPPIAHRRAADRAAALQLPDRAPRGGADGHDSAPTTSSLSRASTG